MEQNKFIQRNKKKYSKKGYSTNYRSSRPEVFCKTGRNLKNLQENSTDTGTGVFL